MADFFISYTGKDTAWAEWIAFVLEEESYTVIIQAWDFRPGNNFVVEMQRATSNADRTIMVLSPDYLKSMFGEPEWAAAFSGDPQGLRRKLVPVMARECNPPGLLTPIVQIRLFGVEEDEARQMLLGGVAAGRAKPVVRPGFPGLNTPASQVKAFPGPHSNTANQPLGGGVIPGFRRKPTDMEKRRFARTGFDTIRAFFEASLEAAERKHSGHVETDFQADTPTDFRAEIFVDGTSRSACRIWMGGMLTTDSICYSEGRAMPRGSCNDVIALAQNGNELQFNGTMSMGVYPHEREFDTKHMSAEQTATYLWRRFVGPLGR